MKDEKEILPNLSSDDEAKARREALKKLGKYATYVAPFTLMALSAKGAAVSGPFHSSRPTGGH